MGIIRRVIVGIIALVVIIVALVILFNLFLIAIIGAIVIAIVAVIVGLFRRMQRSKFRKTMDETRGDAVKKAGPVLDVDYKVKSK